MLKTAPAAGPTNKNPEQDGQRIQVEDQDEKKPIQKSRKGQKGQKTVKSKKWICAKKAEASRAKNLGQSNMFFIANARKTFIKLRSAFVEASILNHFNSERHIQIETDASGYAISRIFSQLTLDNLGQ